MDDGIGVFAGRAYRPGRGGTASTFYRLFPDKFSLNNWCQSFSFSVGIRQIGRSYSWADGLYMAYSCACFLSGVASGSFGGADGRETGSFSQRCIRACLADTHEAVRGLPCMGRLAFRVEFYAGARGPFGALITGRRPSPPVTCAPSSTSWPAACRATVRRAEGPRRAQADVHHGRRRPGPRGPTCGRGVLPECVGFPSP